MSRMLAIARLATIGSLLAVFATDTRAVDAYASTIQPILAQSCYSCHGEKRQKGGLRLDSPEAIAKGGKSGTVLVAGDPAKSPLYTRTILPAGDDDIMPAKGDHLSQDETAAIERWIKAGANFGPASSAAPAVVPATPTPAIAPAKADAKADPKSDATAEAKPDAKPDASKPDASKPDVKKELPPLPTTDLDQQSLGVKVPDAKLLKSLAAMGIAAHPLSANQALIELDFSQTKAALTAEMLKPLESLADNVVWLDFAGAQVSDRDLSHLEGLKRLTRLHLEKTEIGDKGLAHLAGLTQLEYLNLYGTKVTDAGLAQLASLVHLKSLYLWQTKATPAGVEKLSAADPGLQASFGEDLPEAGEPKPDKKKGGKKK